MKLFLTAMALVLVAGCAEKNPNHKKNPLQGLPETATFESKSALQKAITYKSKNLQVTYPNPKSYAKILIHASEAEEIYSKLRVDPNAENRKGHHISCTKKICELELDYANGSVLATNENDSPIGNDTHAIKLKGQDALILYMLLNVVEIDGKSESLKKIGQDYSCTKKSSDEGDDEYSCKLDIDAASGKVIAR